MLAISAIIIFAFFFIYLPNTTKHGETIIVPDLDGMELSELEKFLSIRSLRVQISDSNYLPGHKPLTVIGQYPPAGSIVKQRRRIYVSINTKNPPKVKMPDLINSSLKNALLILKTYGLQFGGVTYVHDLARNAVLNQLFNGEEIEHGELIPKGSKIHLFVGNGLGNVRFDVPDLVGRPFEQVELFLLSQGLKVGLKAYVPESDEEDGTVTKQKPAAFEGIKIRIGGEIDVWVAGEEIEADSRQ